MSSLYLSHREMTAIKAIDIREVERRVSQALYEGRPSALYELQLSGSGSHIASRLHRYERDLANYAKAKAATKRSETRSRAWSSGHDLVDAVRDMKGRVEEQEEETQLLRIDDQISPPYRFGDRVEVRVGYQWRASADAAWAFGAITFFHNVDMRPDYTRPQPARKPSAAKLEEQRQETLFRYWDHLRMLALHSVREFLKSGGDGSTIPKEFEAKPARTDRHLNNFSCDFWGRSDAIRKFEQAEPGVIQVDDPSDEISSDGRLKLHCRVKHAKFGEGIVIHIAADKVTADFGERGTKRVLASFLEPLTE
ncbi:hypothetical protein DAH66_15410 [Sphingomonas koreensis]|uniref:Uncharacterized protein n=1 Tax=Sphingomonas koreensis TaxID=93064 RepID=A0A430G127_9SPHN|nr:hypothetical protein [Sphingomonas koreensis]RSY81078.1 hypothetical protein DAH66_15410 [Sphingomonas koreensis]